jgi:hypothetical protein
VATNATTEGVLLRREGREWRAVKKGDELGNGSRLMALPGDRASLDSKNGAVRLGLWGNLPEVSRFPMLESAVVLHANPALDLDFTLDRGRVLVTNLKKEGEAKVRVRFHGGAWDVTLAEPDTEVALELYGRWPRGTPFSKEKERPPEEAPTVDVVFLVLKGQAELNAGSRQFGLRAPPGPAYFHWDSAEGQDRAPQTLEKPPSWVNAKPPDDIREPLKRQRQRLPDEPVAAVLAAELAEADAGARELAVYGQGATDNLSGLVDCVGNTKHGDVRERAVEALRHWIGRGPQQDLRLYDFLMQDRKYTAAQAETVLQLLHSFSRTDVDRPETYEVLIAYLLHDKLPVRELAKWHLYRLARAGKAIAYDPAGPEAAREEAVKKWKALIPDGKLPPEPPPERKPKD